MGHIINALAFRLGWVIGWSDSWYTNYLYYSEYLHAVLRMRLFLIYFFSSPMFSERGFLYSHFEIYSQRDIITVNIFYYDCTLRRLCNKLLSEFSDIASTVRQNDHKVKFRYVNFWRVFVFLTYSLNFFFKLKNYLIYYRLLFFIFAFKKFAFNKLFNKSKYVFNQLDSFYLNKKISFIMVFITLTRDVLALIKSVQKRKTAAWNTLFSRFFFVASSYHWNSDLFAHLKFFFSYFFSLFTPFDKFDLNFYLLSNAGLTSSFVSRYVTTQLRFGHDIKDILGTLRVEFRQIRARSKENFSTNYIDKLYSKLVVRDQNKKYFFNSFATSLCYFASRQSWIYFKRLSSWLSVDTLFLYSNLLSSESTLNFMIGFSVLFSLNYFGLNFFFGNKSAQILDKSNSSFKTTKIINIFSFHIFLKNVKFILEHFFAGFSSVLFNKTSSFLNLVFFKLINLSLNRFLTHNYYNYNATRNWQLSGLNFKFIRNFKTGVLPSLLGFKLSCLGRFSRRQRVRKVYFSDFKLPLTQVSATIDYNSSVIPLENSAVSVKVWLYKSNRYPSFYFKSL